MYQEIDNSKIKYSVTDNHSWNKKLVSCLRLTHKIKTVGNLKDYLEKNSRYWHCKQLVQTIINKIL